MNEVSCDCQLNLVKKLKEGDERAFESLYQSTYKAVFRTAYLVLGSPEQAEDIAQDAYLQLWRHRGRLQEGPMLPWLLKVATNACFSFFRRKREFLLEEEPEIRDSQEVNPEDRLFYLQVLEMINGLPKRQRAIIALRLLQDLSEEETASICGCAPGTVRATLFQAKEKIRRHLGTD